MIEVGKKYIVKNEHSPNWDDEGHMDAYMGRIVTIASVAHNGCFHIEQDEGDNRTWFWEESDFIPLTGCIAANDLATGGVTTQHEDRKG